MGGLKMNKINVAIADDNQRTVEMMTELLEQESDIEVIASADDGEEALRIIKEKQPDVVLLDIIMPKLDGIGVLERLQTEDLSKRPIIIMVSAMGQENVCEEAMELGSGKYNVISVRDNGVDTLDDIIKLKPDLVVIDLMLSEIDGIGVIEKCRELIEPDKIPAFIALTMLENRELMECIRRLKVDYCMMKPFQAGILAERISQMIRIRSVNNDIQKNEKALHGRSKRMCSMCGTNDVRRQISFLVRNLGVPAHIKGCRYMKYAILMAIEDCNRINYITKLLYPEIAKKCKTTTSSVERAIRHAIDIVWTKGNQELLKEIFGTFVMEGQERPTNSQFIAAVADWMRLEHQIKVS